MNRFNLLTLRLAVFLLLSSVMFLGCKKDSKSGGPAEVLIPEHHDQEITFNLLFDGNGSTYGKVPEELQYTQSAIIPDKGSMVRTGYQFLGWAKSANANTPDFKPGDNFSAGNQTLYAVWQNIQVSVVFHIDAQDKTQINELVFTGIDYDRGLIYMTYPISNIPEGKQHIAWEDADGKLYYFDTVLDLADHDLELFPVIGVVGLTESQEWQINKFND